MERKPFIQKKSPSNLKWFKNVIRSLGYTSSELVTTLLPSVSQFVTTNYEAGQELANNLKNMKSENRSVSSMLADVTQIDIGKKALKNALEDIKSGNIYNKARKDSLFADDDEDFSMESFDLDDSFDFDDSKDIDTSKSKSPKPVINIKTVTPPIGKNNPMVKAIEKSNEISINNTMVQVDAMSTINASQMLLHQKLGVSTLKGLDSINENLGLLVNFQNESMTKYIGASLKYYDESLETMKASLEHIKKSVTPNSPKINKISNPIEDVLLYGGGLNLKGYIEQIKKNFIDQTSSNMFLQPIKAIFEDTDTLKYLAASPLSFISTKIVTSVIPTFLQEAVKNFDTTFKSFFPAMIMKINKLKDRADNPLLQLLGDIFGVDAKSKANIDLSKYNRGITPFDGETKKSIIEVIPGYLRKILAAVTGNEEIGFDYNTGKWSTIENMNKKFNSDKENSILNAYSEAIDEIKFRSKAFEFDTLEQRKEFNEGIEKFFINLSKNNSLINPNTIRKKNGEVVNELDDVYNFNGNSGFRKLFQNLVKSLPKSDQIRIFGQDTINARQNVKSFMERIEENPLNYNANLLFNEMGFDQHLIKGKKTNKLKKGATLFNQVDNYGFNSLDYLRDIKTILLKGIRVFFDNNFSNQDRDIPNSKNSFITDHDNELARMKDASLKLFNERMKDESDTPNSKSNDPKSRYTPSLKLDSMSDEYITDIINGYADDHLRNQNNKLQNKSFTQWLGKFFKGNKQDKYNLLREKLSSVIEKPASILKGVFEKIDNTMYSIIFGVSDKNGISFMDRTMAKIQGSLDKISTFAKEKVFEPVKEFLIGKEGIFTKFKESDFYKNLFRGLKGMNNYLFGEMGADGLRAKGLFSNVGNAMLDTWDNFRYYFTGKAYTSRSGVTFQDNTKNSVFGEVKSMLHNFTTDMKSYFVGDKKSKDPDQQKGVLTNAIDSIRKGMRNWSDALFGPKGVKYDKDKSIKELTEDLKRKAPKALAWGTIGAGAGLLTSIGGGMGILGGLILPGGPIGAAVVGTTMGFLSQSDRFKDWLFGPKDLNNERIGGVISKSAIDFFKKNRVPIIGGAAIGALKPILGFGLLPSFILPGGPIGGALMGVAGAMLFRSEKFQNFMFGEKGLDGKRMGGFAQKVFGKFKTGGGNLKDSAGNAIVGAIGGAGLAAVIGKMGFMGAMLTPFGPIGGAIAGAAAGIALSSDKWKKAIFGEWDEKTGLRKGGILGKFTNWFKLEVAEPLKLEAKKIFFNFQNWFTTKISNPFQKALNPMQEAFKDMVRNMTNMFKSGWDSFREKIGTVFEENVGKPFGRFMSENVMKPLKGFLSKIIRGTAAIFKPIAEAPVQILTSISNNFRKKQEKRGLEKHIEDGWADMKDYRGRRDRGEKMGFFSTKDRDGNKIGKGIFGRFSDMYFSKAARDNARYGEFGAHYAREDDAKFAKKEQEQRDKHNARMKKLEEEYERLNKRRKLGLQYDYDNFDGNGLDISRIYNITKSKSGFKHFVNGEGIDNYKKSLKERFGFNPNELFNMRDENIDWGNLSKSQRKFILKALKTGLSGQALKDKLKIKTSPDIIFKPEDGTGSDNDSKSSGFKTIGEKLENVIKDSSPKEEIKSLLSPKVDTTNNKLTEISNKISNILGFKSSFNKNEKNINDIKNHNTYTGPTKSDNYDNLDNKNKSDKNKKSILQRIEHYTRIIASEVKGQLDGVGSNVFKIRKIIQKANSITDEDLTGSANRDRIGFWGRFRRAIFSPIITLKEKIGVAVSKVVEKITLFGKAIVDVSKTIISIPIKMVKGLYKGFVEITKSLWEGTKSVVKGLAKIPGAMVDAIGQGIKGMGLLFKGAFNGISKMIVGIGDGLGRAASGLGYALKGAGKAVGGFVEGVGKLGGTVLNTLVKMTGSLSSFLTKTTNTLFSVAGELTKTFGSLLTSTTKMIAKFTLNTITGVGKVVTSASKALLDIVASPFKLISKSVGKLLGTNKQEVYVTGGVLDNVRIVESIKHHNNDNNYTSLIHAITKAIKDAQPFIVKDSGVGGNFNTDPDEGQGFVPHLIKNKNNSFRGNIRRGINNGISAISSSFNKGRMGNQKGIIGSSFTRFINKKRGSIANKSESLNILSNSNKNIIPLGNGSRTLNLLNNTNKFTNGKSFLGKVPGYNINNLLDGNNPLNDKKSYMKDFVSRRNIDHELSVKAEREEKQAAQGFKIANVGLLSMVESNTRRSADVLENTFGKKGLLTRLLAGFVSWIMGAWKIFDFLKDMMNIRSMSKMLGNNQLFGSTSSKNNTSTTMAGSGRDGKNGKDGGGAFGPLTSGTKDKGDKKSSPKVKPITIPQVLKPAVGDGSTPRKFRTSKNINDPSMSLNRNKGNVIQFDRTASNIPNYGTMMSKNIGTTGSKTTNGKVISIEDIIAKNKDVKKTGLFSKISNGRIGSITKVGSRLLSNIPYLNIAMGGIAGYDNMSKANEIFGLEDGEEATKGQKTAAALAGGAIGMIPGVGVVDLLTGGRLANWTTKATYKVGSWLGDVGGSIKDTASNIWDKTKGVMGGVNNLVKYLNPMGLMGLVTKGFVNLKDSKIGEAISDQISALFNIIKSGIGTIITGAKNSISSIANFIGRTWNNTKEWVVDIGGKIGEKTSKIWGGIKSGVSEAWDKTSSFVINAKDVIQEKTSKIWGGIKSGVSKAWDKTSSFVINAKDVIQEKTSKIWGGIKSGVSEAWDKTSSFVINAKDKIKEKTSKIWGDLTTGVSEAWESVTTKVKSTFTSIKDKVSNVFSSVFGSGKIKDTDLVPAIGGGEDKKYEQLFGAGTYYSQNDPRWAGRKIDKSGKGLSFSKGGCGPTSAAMALSTLTGRNITPIDTLKYAQDEGFIHPDKGTRSDYFPAISKKYGVNMIDVGNNENIIKKQLSNNKPVILRGENGSAYTNGGHYVVATGITSGGKVKINDPLGKSHNKSYDIKSLMKNTTSGFVSTESNDKYGAGNITSSATFGLGPSTSGPFKGWTITSQYGWRKDPFTGAQTMHRGIDLVKSHMYPIPSFTNGTVIYSGWGRPGTGYGNYGNVVCIRDERGYQHLYAHLHAVKLSVGDRVKKGTIVGLQGSTGNSTGSHLHYEVRKNGYKTDVNPTDYLNSYIANKDFTESISGKSTLTSTNGSSNLSLNTSLSSINGSSNSEGFITRLSNIFAKYSSIGIFNEDPTKDNYTNSSSSSSSSSSPGLGFNLDNFIPKNEQEAILKKTIELTVANETGSKGDYFAGKNGIDANMNKISPDVGILQWRGNSAQKIMQSIAKGLPNNKDAQYLAYDVDWNSRTPWSSTNEKKLQSVLRADPKLTKDVQNDFARRYVQNTNLDPVYKYGVSTKKITDPRSIVMLGEFANTGPAHVKTFMDRYRKNSSGDEFSHFVNEFKNKSYWGGKLGTYNSRVEKDIAALKNWKASYGSGLAMGGPNHNDNKAGEGYVDDSDSIFGLGKDSSTKKLKVSKLSHVNKVNYAAGELYGQHIYQQFDSNSSLTKSEIVEIIKLLKEISNNTFNTNNGLSSLSAKMNISGKGDGDTNNITIVDKSSRSLNKNPSTSQNDPKVNKRQREYNIAKQIAGAVGII